MTDTQRNILIWILAAGTCCAPVLGLLLALTRRRHAVLAKEQRRLVDRLDQERQGFEERLDAARAELAKVTERADAADGRLRAMDAELRHLAGKRLPALAVKLAHPHYRVPGLLDPELEGTGLEQTLEAVMDAASTAVVDERARIDAAAQAAIRGASSQVQALLYQNQDAVREMYDWSQAEQDPSVAAHVFAIDHRNEQALHRAQVTAVVGGGRTGLNRADSYLSVIVRGAASRLAGYARVQIHNQMEQVSTGVIAHAVEPVAITVAAFLENALYHSDEDVIVTLKQGVNGVTILIDDYGIGMHDDELERALELMSGDETVVLAHLGEPPRTGFAAIGRLVKQYGFRVHLQQSPYGGVRAIVGLPADPLLLLLDEETHPMPAGAPMPVRSAARRKPAPVPSPGPAGVQAKAQAQAGVPAGTPVREPEPVREPVREPEPESAAAASDVPAVPAAPAVPADAGAVSGDASGDELGGLPRRRRSKPSPAAAEPAEASAPYAVPDRTPQEAEDMWTSWAEATRRPEQQEENPS